MNGSLGENLARLKRVEKNRPEEAREEPAGTDPLARLNTDYCVVEDGGRVRVLTFKTVDVGPGRQRSMPVYLSFDDFANLFSNQRIYWKAKDGNPKSVSLGRFWLSHSSRRTYRGVVFRPNAPQVIGDRLNLWQGWGVEPRHGSWERLRDHIALVLADGDEARDDYIMHWLAFAVQHPDLPAETALVFRGGRGTGKGTLGNALAQIFGQHGLHISSATQLAGRFNAHLRDCSFLFADEAYWPGDKAAEGNLKRLISEPTLAIEGKGRDVVTAPNMLHVMMASNEEWIVPAGEHERRFVIHEVPDDHRQDAAWFGPIHAEMKNGGLEAMLHDLLAVDLEGWHPRQIIHTGALVAQQSRTLDAEDEWWVNMLDNGVIPGCVPDVPHTVVAGDYEDTVQETNAFGSTTFRTVRHVGPYTRARASSPRLRSRSDEFLAAFLKRMGCSNRHRVLRRRGWAFPPLSAARTEWLLRFPGWTFTNPEQVEWLPEEAGDENA